MKCSAEKIMALALKIKLYEITKCISVINGLPGLIVKISDDDNEYVFELADIKKQKKRVKIKVPLEDYIETDKEKLAELVQENKKHPMRAVESAGIKIGFSKQQKENLKKSRMSRNNPIELK